MKSNTQNAKIEAITENFDTRMMSEVKRTMPEPLITEESSIQGSQYLSLATQRKDL